MPQPLKMEMKMKNRIYVKPASGCRIPMPDGKTVPDDGQFVENSRFIRRRLKSGDLIACDPPVPPEKTTFVEILAEEPGETDPDNLSNRKSKPREKI